jgi:hypothetical protein
VTETFSAEARLIHAGTERLSGQPATPPLVPASIYVSEGTPVTAGAVVSRDQALLAELRAWRTSGGGIPGPFEAWLALRGWSRPGSAGPDGRGRRRRTASSGCRSASSPPKT